MTQETDRDDTKSPPTQIDRANTVLFAGFEGCLVENATRLENLYLPETLGSFLEHAYTQFDQRMVIVSRFPASEVAKLIPLFIGPIYGDSGSEVYFDGFTVPLVEQTTEAGDIANLIRDFCAKSGKLRFTQDKRGFSVSFSDAPQEEPAVRSFLNDLAMLHKDFEVVEGADALLLCPVNARKDRVITDAMDRFAWVGKMPVHLGANPGDEAAFAALSQFGGFGVKVGQDETQARYRVTAPHDVHILLSQWADGASSL